MYSVGRSEINLVFIFVTWRERVGAITLQAYDWWAEGIKEVPERLDSSGGIGRTGPQLGRWS